MNRRSFVSILSAIIGIFVVRKSIQAGNQRLLWEEHKYYYDNRPGFRCWWRSYSVKLGCTYACVYRECPGEKNWKWWTLLVAGQQFKFESDYDIEAKLEAEKILLNIGQSIVEAFNV